MHTKFDVILYQKVFEKVTIIQIGFITILTWTKAYGKELQLNNFVIVTRLYIYQIWN